MSNIFASFRDHAGANLGPLEQRVLEAVWLRGTATVRELIEDGNVWQTYPTIMTTMDRLFKKGLLDRVLEGRAFRYSPRYTREELERAASVNGIRELLGSERASMHLSYLVEAVGAQGEALLDELQALIEQRKADMRKGEQK